MKHISRKVFIITSILLFLCACRHENPLKTHPSPQSLSFLFNASANAEKRLGFPIHQDAYGYAYLECMEGKKSPEIHCEALYQAMVEFAKEGDYLGFEGLSLADLKDSQLFNQWADDYAELAATTVPYFVAELHS